MDSPRKNNDCYFYYYSTCLKGEGCMFRHEPAALGCETVCTFWQQGKCLNQRCNFRHMELRKNRKIIPCYWETQPGGCRKPHCSFQHKNPREPVGQDIEKNKECENVGASKSQERAEWSRRTVLPEGAQFEECVGSSDDSGRVGPRRVSQGSETSYGSPPVDPLVVNFEEESDNESVPTSTPTKKPQKNVHVKTLEEIRLERIQAESAAFYSYKENPAGGVSDLRSRIVSRKPYSKPSQDFRVLSLDEIRKRKALEANSGSDNCRNECVDSERENSQDSLLKFDTSVVNSIPCDSAESIVEDRSGKSLSSVNQKSNSSISRDDEHPLKRSLSPITFETLPKKSCLSRVDHLGDNSVINKENNLGEAKMDKELPSTLRKFRKPLKRGPVNETVSGKPQTGRVIRLRRKNVMDSNAMDISEYANGNNQVSSIVPADIPFENQDCVLNKDSNFKSIESSGRMSPEGENEISCVNKNYSQSNSSDAMHTNNELLDTMESIESVGDTLLKDSEMCDSSLNDKWPSSTNDDELYLGNTEYPVVLKADEDILQDIDDLLRE